MFLLLTEWNYLPTPIVDIFIVESALTKPNVFNFLTQMILLDKTNYNKALEPLLQVKINNLFARAVIENHTSGKVYVDDPSNPTTFYVLHSYGMSLLFGHCHNEVFNQSFKKYALNQPKVRSDFEFMQAYPNTWDPVLKDLFADKLIKSSERTNNQESGFVELNTRINFKFNPERFRAFKQEYSANGLDLRRSGKEIYHDMKGSVVPLYFWENADDFIDHGVGFSLFENNHLACTAYSAFVIDQFLELGIETIPEFRGKGYAQHTCAALIDYCNEKGFEPVWACRLENTGSYKLAQKIGFVPSAEIPYYKLSN